MSAVCVWAKNILRVWNQRGKRVRKIKRNVQRVVGLQSLTLKWIPYNFVGNVGLYSVGEDMREAFQKQPSRASCEIGRELAKLRATREMPLTLETFELPACAPHMAFRRLHHSCASRKTSCDMHCLHIFSPNSLIELIILNSTKIQEND